ncbi:MAG: DUF418 domain-containing protein [bacterium]
MDLQPTAPGSPVENTPEIQAESEVKPPRATKPAFVPLMAGSKTRVIGLDAVRGFALLGILMLNIVDFAWPNQAYDSVRALYYVPESIGAIPDRKAEEKAAEKDKKKDEWKWLEAPKPDLKGVYPNGELRVAAVDSEFDIVEWAWANVFFANKMRTLFCIMFGAGIVYLTDRIKTPTWRHVWLYYRRMLILLLIGAVHGYLIWHGDILFMYAAVGLYLYPFKRLGASQLAWIAVSFFAFFVSLMWVGAGVFHHIQVQGKTLEKRVLTNADKVLENKGIDDQSGSDYLTERRNARTAEIDRLELVQRWTLQAYRSTSRRDQAQQPEELTRDIRLYRNGSYFSQIKDRAGDMIWVHLGTLTPLSPLLFGWLMILGMSLAKTGFFAGDWPETTYQRLAFRLVPLGWLIEAGLTFNRTIAERDNILSLTVLMPLQQAVIPMISLGYAAAIILAIRKGRFAGFTDRLASVGRMALSNYLAQSLICTFLFYSIGFGLFGSVRRVWLVLVVLSVWLIELWWSPLWLAGHSFGPVEWVWRSLAYLRVQPWRKKAAEEPNAA